MIVHHLIMLTSQLNSDDINVRKKNPPDHICLLMFKYLFEDNIEMKYNDTGLIRLPGLTPTCRKNSLIVTGVNYVSGLIRE